MPKIPRLLLPLALAALLCTTVQAQKETKFSESPFYYRNCLTEVIGVQYFNNQSSIYSCGFSLMYRDYYYACNVFDISLGYNYISYSPLYLASIPLGVSLCLIIEGKGGGPISNASIVWRYINSSRFYYPLGKHFEVFAGWDTFKLTKMKDISSAWYLTGSLTAGINYYVNKYLYISGYYEFNHTHNPFTRSLNWALGGLGVNIPDQPKALNGHSVGIQIGCRLF